MYMGSGIFPSGYLTRWYLSPCQVMLTLALIAGTWEETSSHLEKLFFLFENTHTYTIYTHSIHICCFIFPYPFLELIAFIDIVVPFAF